MNEPVLPKDVVDRFERRWAGRIARDGLCWRSEKPLAHREEAVISRKGRVVPVAFKRATGRSPMTKAQIRI